MSEQVVDSYNELVSWIEEETGAEKVVLERRSAGGSRAGFAVDATVDGTSSELWLRCDTGAGPQSGGPYTLRREAEVYQELHKHGMKVAEVVAVHPSLDAFLMKRLYGQHRFGEVASKEDQNRIASELMEQLANLHRLDVRALDLPTLGAPRALSEHVDEELDIWERQFRTHDEPEPTIELALAWLRRSTREHDDSPTVLVQGDTGPGNFMFSGGQLVAVTDWELSHYGDFHDDLAWLYVHDLQERLPDLPAHLEEYTRRGGHRVDPERLRYFLVLAQMRCAIGTRNGLLARDSRAEVAGHMVFTTLHTRSLADALAIASHRDAPTYEPMPDTGESSQSWMFDVMLDDLRSVVVPAIEDGFAARRAKGVARLAKYLRENERFSTAIELAEVEDLANALDAPIANSDVGRRELCARIRAGEISDSAALDYCVGYWARRTQVMRPAMGVLADRRYSPLPNDG